MCTCTSHSHGEQFVVTVAGVLCWVGTTMITML